MDPAVPTGSYARGVDKNHRKLDASCVHLVQRYAQLLGKIEEFDFDGVWDTKPCINGREMFKLLPHLKKGPIVGQIMQRQIEWMITHPNAATALVLLIYNDIFVLFLTDRKLQLQYKYNGLACLRNAHLDCTCANSTVDYGQSTHPRQALLFFYWKQPSTVVCKAPSRKSQPSVN
eukprot:IDg18261t1